MADLQSSAITPAITPNLSGTTAAGASSNLTAIPVTVTTVSDALANLTRTIQTNATPLSLTDNTLSLATALGTVNVTLPQLAVAAVQQNMMQQLLNMVSTQRPLTLSLQPGSPPTQAVILVPSGSQPSNQVVTQPPSSTQNVSTPTQSQALPATVLAKGETLPALVLPSSSFLPQPVLGTTSSYAPALPNVGSSIPATSQPVTTGMVTATPSGTTAIPASIISSAGTTVVPTPITVPVSTAPTIPVPPAAIPAAPVAGSTLTPAPSASPQPASVAFTNAPAQPQVPAAGTTTTTTTTTTTVSAPAPSSASTVAQQAPTAPVPAASGAPIIPLTVTPPASQPATIVGQNPAVVQSNAPLLQPGNEVTLQIDEILPPTTSPVALQAPPNLAANQIFATVTGTTPDGKLLLQSGDMTLFVKAQVNAPVGTNLILTVETAKQAPLLPLPITETQNFQSLPQIVAALAQVNPQALMQMLSMHIPQPTESLAGALLQLFGTFKQGDVRGLLGNTAAESLLSAGKDDLIASLTRDLSSAGQTAQDPVVGEWRAYPVPLYSQQQFQAVTLYVHNDRNSSHGRDTVAPVSGKIRFLIDMRLSKLGSMQLDGFVQPKKLDMIVRSESLLPAGLHNELRSAYIRAMGAVGYTGSLNFQIGRQHWLMMQKNVPQGILT